MPPRRRPAPLVSAADLPPSRLPLGTPQLTRDGGSPKPTQASPKDNAKSSTTQRDSFPITSNKSEPPSAMASSNSPSTGEPTSLAAAKLERQRKRIAEAEAALTAPLPLDRQRQASRGKGKWKPFDYAADSAQVNLANEGGVLIAESRINVFRPSSRGSSLSRPISRLSHHTADSHATDLARQDTLSDTGDFQLYTGRRGRKNVGSLSAYQDTSSPRQTTVEATFSKREITDVFGNELPGPGFMDGNPGYVNGQLQFIQHPNGDVAAHQWSCLRYEWENIGQFSNIRKKIEGQLAADRVQGETAWQALQQNTLAYFRTIAKQREAAVTGQPFGVKEILAALPDLRPPSTAPTGPRALASNTRAAQGAPAPFATAVTSAHLMSLALQDQTAAAQDARYQAQQVRPSTRFDPVFNFTPTPEYSHQDDPFLASGPYGKVYVGQQSGARGQQDGSYSSSGTHHPQQSAYTYSYEVPRHGTSTYAQHNSGLQTYGHDHTAFAGQIVSMALQARRAQSLHPQPPASHAYDQHHHAPAAYGHSPAAAAGWQAPSANSPVSQQQVNSATPLSSRTAMRESLMRLGETAKERNLSQSNIRTVLYDPYQTQPSGGQSDVGTNQMKQEEAPAVNNQIADSPLEPRSLPRARSHQHMSVLTPLVASSCADRDSAHDEILPGTGPDHGRAAISEAHYVFASPQHFSASKPTPQNFMAQSFAEEPLVAGARNAPNQKNYDEELKDWWRSGTKFQRQEDFYGSIIAAQKTSSSSLNPNSPTGVKPIGSAGKAIPATTDNELASSASVDMTRLLIPVYENLASYIEGPWEQRYDFFARWNPAPEWCIDRSPRGHLSLWDKDSDVQIPARIGRDLRYRGVGAAMPAFGGFGGGGPVVNGGLGRRFALGVRGT